MFTPLFLEQPVKLFFYWLMVQIVITILWWFTRSRQSFNAFWISITSIVLLESLSILVVTPREQIQRLCSELVNLIQDQDSEGFVEHIDHSFEASGYDRDRFVDRVKPAIERILLSDIQLKRLEVQLPEENKGVAEFDVDCVVQTAEMPYRPILSRWRLTLIRREDQWKVVHIKALPRPLSPIRSLRQCLK